MRVVVIVPGFVNESAGTSYSVVSLCGALHRAGVSVELHSLRRSAREFPFPVVIYRRSERPLLARLGWSREMAKGMEAVAHRAELMHMNGVWMMPDVYPALKTRGTACKVVCCPHGGLSEVTLARNRIVKWVMWHLLGQKAALKRVSMFHAASEKERAEIRALGFRQPVAVIPNGLELPKVRHRPFASSGRKLVFFGRIHATKAVDHLVAAWGRVAREFPDWSLEIAGPDCGAVPALREMIAERGIPRVAFVGELHGDEKYGFLAAADLYVLPSLTENFGITVAEALACGTPSIVSRGCPWRGLEEHGCGWWIDIGPEALAAKLREVLAFSPQELERMGERGKAWISSGFTWEDVARKMRMAYEWLLHGGERPEFVDVVGGEDAGEEHQA